MESEVALHDEAEALRDAAADPAGLYGVLTTSGATDAMIGLMGHENADLAGTALSVWAEWLDPALLAPGETEEGERTARARNVGGLAKSAVDGGGLELACANLVRFDESMEEERKGMEDALTLAENLLDLDLAGVLTIARGGAVDNVGKGKKGPVTQQQSVVAAILRNTTLLSWLVTRIGRKDRDENAGPSGSFPPIKLHACEILASILQHDDARVGTLDISCLPAASASALEELGTEHRAKNNGKPRAKVDGIEMLLQAVAPYRKRDPRSAEECEFLENAFDALAACLLSPSNIGAFLEAEGLELMLRCVKSKVHAGGGALRVTHFCLSGDDRAGGGDAYKRSCEAFVEAGGMKVVFPIFMGKGSAIPIPATCSDAWRRPDSGDRVENGGTKKNKRARRTTLARREWLRSAEGGAVQTVYALTRHLDESSPNDARRRLLSKFLEADLEKCDRAVELVLQYDGQARAAEYRYYREEEAEETTDEAMTDLAATHARLRGGGDLLHCSAAVLAFACAGSRRCHEHILGQLRAKGAGMGTVKGALEEFVDLLGEGAQQKKLGEYLRSLL